MKFMSSRILCSLFVLSIWNTICYGQIIPPKVKDDVIEDTASLDVEKLNPDLFSINSFYNDLTREIGNTPGNASVSATGGAIYTIPIALPKGHGDFAPSIALSYNSQAGNGIAGSGFNISGISVITRGTKDIYHDGTAQGIKYQSNDAYYLDGKRLILSSGTAGADGAIYAPEGEALTQITLHNTGDIWFEAKTTDGMRYEYGHTSTSRQTFTQNSTTITNAWYVNKAENLVGLELTYAYITNNYFLYPQTISYGAGNTINFEYENRYDAQPFILGTTKGSMSLRLKRIVSKYNSTIYRQYQINYFTDKIARISSITELDASGKSLHPLQFRWNEIGELVPQSTNVSANLSVTDNCGFVAGDFNGDGKSDIVQLYEGSNSTFAYVSQSAASDTYPVAFANPITCAFSKVYFTDSSISIHELLPAISDFDGDGLDDLLFPYLKQSGSTTTYRLEYVMGNNIKSATGTLQAQQTNVISSSESILCSADFNNDGKTDLFVIEKTSSNSYYPCHLLDYNGTGFADRNISLSLPSIPQRLFASDFNHDGLADILVVYDSGYKIFWNYSGVLSNFTFSNTYSMSGTNLTNTALIEMGDFNGDGVPDFITNSVEDPNWYFKLGNGDGTHTTQLAAELSVYQHVTNAPNRDSRCLVFDFDRDGKSDVVIHKVHKDIETHQIRTRTLWMRSTGNALTLQKEASSKSILDGLLFRIMVGDFRGIGYPELMNYGNDCYDGIDVVGTPQLRLYQMGYAGDGNINAVRGSYGNFTYFSYASLANADYYTKGTGCTYPMRDIAAPLCVVRTHQESGRSIGFADNYTYSGLKAQVLGRGLIGFSSIRVSRNAKIVTTTTMSGWENNSYMIPTHTLKTIVQDGHTSTEETTFALKTFNSNYVLYPSTIAERDFYNHLTQTVYTYNQDLGYIQQEYTFYDTNNMFKRTSYNNYAHFDRVYRPQTILYEQKHIDDTNIHSTTTKFTYKSNGLVDSKTEFFGTPKSLKHAYTYDSYGNVLSEKLTGTDISDITHSYQYSSDGKQLIKSYTLPASISMQYTYDVYGNLQYETDITDPSAAQVINRYNYNGFGILTSYKKLNDFSPTITRGWGNSPYEKTYMLERCQGYPWKKTWYDTNGRVSKVESAGPHEVAIESVEHCNGFSQPTYREERNGSIVTTENLTYDTLNRPLSRSFSSGKTINYSYDNRTITTVEDGREYTKVFDAWGNVKESTDPVSSVTYTYCSNGKINTVISENDTVSMSYDIAGNQISLTDPDAGMMTYEYDVLGRLKKKTDARGIETTYIYDAANRVVQKTIDGVATTYTYGSSGNSTNCLTSIQTGDRSIAYTYDSSRKIVTETRSMSGESPMTFQYEYSNDNIQYTTYPNGLWLQNNNDGFGNTLGISLDGGTNIWYLDSSDGKDDLIKIGGTLEYADDPYADDPEMQDDPIYSFYQQEYFDVPYPVMTQAINRDTKGFLSSATLNLGNSVVSQFTYTHDYTTGNLLSRTGMLNQQETFTYDELDRLTNVTIGGTSQTTINYNAKGNIINKTGLGTYYYSNGNIRPHAITAVDNTNGQISTGTQTVAYNALGKVSTITEGAYTLEITYGPDEQRWKSVLKNNGVVIRKTIYAGNYERVTEGSTTRHFCYLEGGAVYVTEGNDEEGTAYYIVTDNLGSVTKLVDIDGNVAFEASYDAWGKQTVSSGNMLNFHRGYTGHEMLSEFGLVNMNGRLYDPALGRFLSPDNYVQMPDFSQSFNRYSYCLNNPLKYTDSDGELFGIDDAIIIGFAIAGAANVWANWDEINHDWGHGIATFIGGVGAAAVGTFVSPILGAAVLGAGNSIINQAFNQGKIDWGQVGASVSMSLVTQQVGKIVGGLTNNSISKLTHKIGNSILRDWLNGAVDGTIGGFTMGTMFSLGNGENIGNSLKNGGNNAIQGLIIGSMSGLYQGYHHQIKNTIPFRQDAEQKFQEHAFSNGRLDNLGLDKEVVTKRTMQLIENYADKLHDGQNNISLKIQNKPMILRVHVLNGIVYSMNLMPNLSNSGYIRSATPIIFLPDQNW